MFISIVRTTFVEKVGRKYSKACAVAQWVRETFLGKFGQGKAVQTPYPSCVVMTSSGLKPPNETLPQDSR